MLKITQEQLPKLWALLAQQGELYVPTTVTTGTVDFARYEKGMTVDVTTTLTAKSLKDLFFPQVENIVDFTTAGQKIAVLEHPLQTMPTIAFGVRACDVRSFAILDRVFLQAPVDAFYEARRRACTIIGLACSEPEETCFCQSFGIDPTQPESDVVTWLVAGDLYWQAQTAKGEALTVYVKELAEVVEEEQVALQRERTRAVLAQLPLADFTVATKIPRNEERVFASAVWERLSGTCLSCCTCTYVCPTCHCYDIRDYENENKVERFRCWDSCMCADFTKMAHGNPRKSKLERFRQRYMHKLVYFPANNDEVYACVGCGRCLSKCPVNLNIVKVAKALEASDDV
ncbi:MAG: 4Fe-4S dicluster domain-containing protein [Acidaminococcaceae bacterium]